MSHESSREGRAVMNDVSVFRMLVQQLENLPVLVPRPPPFNPRPRGRIIEGFASDVVLRYLRLCGKFQSEGQIRRKVRRSHAAVSWALIYLVRVGLVESLPDWSRSSRYKRYRAVEVDYENKGV